MTAVTPSVIYIDARPLQDPNYVVRGIGQHASSLIESLRRHGWGGRRPRLVAVIDVAAAVLILEHRRLFDDVTSKVRRDVAAEAAQPGPSWFLSLSPVTHDPVWAQAFLTDPELHRIALFYDLIPLQYPEVHLRTPASRMAYVVALAWLRCYDSFAAISRFSSDGLVARMNVDRARVFVSGVAVRRALEPAAGETPPAYADRRWVVVAGGGDPRKNPECVIVAHAKSAAMRRAGIVLKIFGNYPKAMRSDFRALYSRHGGRVEALQFQSHLTDAELLEVYRGGLATVVPSLAEGFSIPIVESSAAGTPVLASDVDAHPELVQNPAWRFDPHSPDQLGGLLDRLATDEVAWTTLQAEQAPMWRDYTVEQVGRNFVEGVLARAPDRVTAPAVRRGARPKIAVLTPLPPTDSGVADYSAVTLRPLQAVAEVHMFTPTAAPRWEPGWASLQQVSAAAYAPQTFDARISVVGNSGHHIEIMDYLTSHGGACIAHDARQANYYYILKGPQAASKIASRELNRPVPPEEIAGWLTSHGDLPTLFFSEIVGASDPLFVHSPQTVREIKRLYSTEAIALPFAQYRSLPLNRLRPERRAAARRALSVGSGALLISTFGAVSEDKAPEVLLWSLKLLLDWKVPAKLVFCGRVDGDPFGPMLDELALREHVRFFDREATEEEYQDHLAASDVGVQLRTHRFGQLSGALNDCVGAALPSIANAHLADAMLAPDFVRRIPDNLSAVLVAEAVLDIVASGENTTRPIEAAVAYRRRHSPEAYCNALLQSLGLDASVAHSVP